MSARRFPSLKTVTLSVTVKVPGWLSKRDTRREVRTLLNEGTVWGTARPVHRGGDGFDSICIGDVRVKRVRWPHP